MYSEFLQFPTRQCQGKAIIVHTLHFPSLVTVVTKVFFQCVITSSRDQMATLDSVKVGRYNSHSHSIDFCTLIRSVVICAGLIEICLLNNFEQCSIISRETPCRGPSYYEEQTNFSSSPIDFFGTVIIYCFYQSFRRYSFTWILSNRSLGIS